MKPQLLSLTLLVLVCMAMIPVQAQTITMANPGSLAERDIAVYWPNGTMYGYYNSTSIITLDTSSDYIFTLKPIASDPLTNPTEWFTYGFLPWIKSNALILVVIGFLVMLYRRGK